MDTKLTSRRYFPGLNGLRFIAAIGVLLHHIEQFKFDAKVPNLWRNTIVAQIGPLGVSLFFVLSGFLITHLLLEEIAATGTIGLRRFYARRILRIWPLYFLVVAWAFFGLSQLVDFYKYSRNINEDFAIKLALYLVVLPNIAAMRYRPVLGASQSWSVGIEEQFYAIWPLLVRRWAHRLPALLVGMAVGKPLFALAMHGLNVALPYSANPAVKLTRWVLDDFLNNFQIELMAIGGIGAWLVFSKRRRVLGWIFGAWGQAASLLAITASVVLPVESALGPLAARLLAGLAFGALILNVACNPRSVIRLEFEPLKTLGNISYGIYMYHATAIVLVMVAVRDWGLLAPVGLAYNAVIYAGSTTLTIALAYISYNYYESIFLRLKDRLGVRTRRGVVGAGPVGPRAGEAVGGLTSPVPLGAEVVG